MIIMFVGLPHMRDFRCLLFLKCVLVVIVVVIFIAQNYVNGCLSEMPKTMKLQFV
jgi:hypothetical protein